MSFQFENDVDALAFIESEPALDIKEEYLSDDLSEIDGTVLEDLMVKKITKRKPSPAPIVDTSSDASSFCILCLRKCSPELKVTFHTTVEVSEPNTVNIAEAQQKLSRALGIQKDLRYRVMCSTCWQLIELITEFRQCCEVATVKLKVFAMGVDYDPEDDAWLAQCTVDAIELKRQMIWNHLELLDVEEKKMKRVARQKKRKQQEKQMKGQTEEVMPVTGQDEVQDQNQGEVQQDAQIEPEIETKAVTYNRSHPSSSEATEPIQLKNDSYKVNIFSCESCGRNFDGHHAFRVHKTHCTLESPMTGKFFTCPICTATFIENSGLTFHLNKHKGIRPYKCRKFCNNTFFSNFTRIKHERKYCEKEGRICDICGMHLKNEASLQKHTECVHGEAKFVCNICGRKFRDTRSHRKHKRVHSEERKYVCTVCNKGFKAPSSLKIHKRLHTQQLPYPCHLCEKIFNYKVSLKNHIERYHTPNETY